MNARRLVLKGNRRPTSIPRSLPLRARKARIEVTLTLRPRVQTAAQRKRIDSLLGALPNHRLYLSRAEHEAAFGLRAADLAKIKAFACRYGLLLLDSHTAKRTVRLRGRVEQVERAFGVRLRQVRLGKGLHHAHSEEVSLPREIRPLVRAVFGLDSRPLMRPHSLLGAFTDGAAGPGAVGNAGYSIRDVCGFYNFPQGLDGAGQCLAVIEVNTANAFRGQGTGILESDLAQSAVAQGLTPPTVTCVPGAHGAGNSPGVDTQADIEAALDVQVAAASAPRAALAVYFGLNCEQGYHDAVAAALHDSTRNPKVISTSWGLSEDQYGASFMTEMDSLFREAATLGVTICASTGDLGSSGKDSGEADALPHAHFPASSPGVLACGGTTLTVQSGAVTGECVWNGSYAQGAGGGGVSETFALPSWQDTRQVPRSPQKKWAGRGIPDLAAHADPTCGYRVIVRGVEQVLGGTSAVAPLIAGLLTCINQSRATAGRGPVGYVHPTLYAHPEAFREIVKGSNDTDGSLGVYPAGPGWNACAGLGAPNGAALLSLLS